MKKYAFIFLILVAFLADMGLSATWDNAKGIGVSFSGIRAKGGDVDDGAIGMMFGGNLKYAPTPYTMFSLDASYGGFKPHLADSDYEPDENSPFETTVIPVQLSLRVTPFAEAALKPYFLLGLGVLSWDLLNNDVSVHDRQMEFNMAAGLGLEWFIAQSVGLDFLLRNSTYPGLDLDNVGTGDDDNRQLLEGRISLNYYWGQNRDRDKDGILDKFDAAPLEAEDVDGFQDSDGAPDPDNDNDGILDADDGAPNEPEDKDGFQDEDGVPDLDNDNDGILDVNDKAPNAAEDKDGFQDDDGAPDPDNDKDGIPDATDKCPNEAENINGYEDDDGCPDVKPMPKLEKAGAALILKGVNFKTGSADLTPESLAILDEVIAGLKDAPEVEIEIRGYTDDVGRAAANQKLSERRAQSVQKYLIDSGITAGRLKAVGLGEENPVASNATPEGRAENRRIEFYRTK
ncbi:OmpA family protein [candidate division KSB1 bacterium]|nr:OmpA family protein [candidate division KSB1 bacterium]